MCVAGNAQYELGATSTPVPNCHLWKLDELDISCNITNEPDGINPKNTSTSIPSFVK